MRRRRILGLPIGPPEPTVLQRWGPGVATVAVGAMAVAGSVRIARGALRNPRSGSSHRHDRRPSDPRSLRAETQRRLKAGEVDLRSVLRRADHDEALGRTRVKVLLQNLPGV